MAYTRFHRPDFAKAMLLPPAPENASIKTTLSFGAEVDMCSAILLWRELVDRLIGAGNGTYFAMDSGVTPNQASSVSQTPSSYFVNMRCRCFQ